MTTFPRLHQTVLDTTDPRGLAEFYRELLGYRYRAGDEPPTDGAPDEADWLVLTNGSQRLAFQQVDDLPRTNWPDPPGVPQQLHLDLTVADDEEEPLYVLTDPAGHPFCLVVG